MEGVVGSQGVSAGVSAVATWRVWSAKRNATPNRQAHVFLRVVNTRVGHMDCRGRARVETRVYDRRARDARGHAPDAALSDA